MSDVIDGHTVYIAFIGAYENCEPAGVFSTAQEAWEVAFHLNDQDRHVARCIIGTNDVVWLDGTEEDA